MSEVLIFGDSLTRGADPGMGRRIGREDRWPNVLQHGLGAPVMIVTDALGGRTTCYDDFDGVIDRNGARLLPTVLASHSPLDLVVIMLGSNDLKPAVSGSSEGVARGIERLLDVVEAGNVRRSLVIAPPPFVASPNHGGQPRGGRSIVESRRLPQVLRAVAARRGAHFFDAGTVAVASPIDGVHLDRINSRRLGMALVPVVRDILAH